MNATLEADPSVKNRKDEKGTPFAVRFAEVPVEATLSPEMQVWCATHHTTVEATGLKTDVKGSDED